MASLAEIDSWSDALAKQQSACSICGAAVSTQVVIEVMPSSAGAVSLPHWLRSGLYFVLPSVNLLSESRFLAITSATLKPMPWTYHATALS